MLNCLEYLNSFVQLVWNEEDESASLLKAISIAVETDIEADDEAIEGKNSGKVSNEDVKEEPKEEMTTGVHLYNISVGGNLFRFQVE